jgi:hypothetical protein
MGLGIQINNATVQRSITIKLGMPSGELKEYGGRPSCQPRKTLAINQMATNR